MKFLLKILLSGSLLALLSACQVYRNNGRNLFENAAPTPTTTVGSPTYPVLSPEEKSKDNCWTQPKDEALWFAESGKVKEYEVSFIDDQSIEVCFEDSDSADSSASLTH